MSKEVTFEELMFAQKVFERAGDLRNHNMPEELKSSPGSPEAKQWISDHPIEDYLSTVVKKLNHIAMKIREIHSE